MKFGLPKNHYQFFIENLLGPLIQLQAHVWVFGSRARGDHREHSDLDILVSPLTPKIEKLVSEVEETFINSNFPYKVDLVFLENIAASYKDQVLQERVELTLS